MTRHRPLTTEEAKELAMEWLVAGESWIAEIKSEIQVDNGRIEKWEDSAWRPAVVRADKVDDGNHRLIPANPKLGDYLCCSRPIYEDDDGQ